MVAHIHPSILWSLAPKNGQEFRVDFSMEQIAGTKKQMQGQTVYVNSEISISIALVDDGVIPYCDYDVHPDGTADIIKVKRAEASGVCADFGRMPRLSILC